MFLKLMLDCLFSFFHNQCFYKKIQGQSRCTHDTEVTEHYRFSRERTRGFLSDCLVENVNRAIKMATGNKDCLHPWIYVSNQGSFFLSRSGVTLFIVNTVVICNIKANM